MTTEDDFQNALDKQPGDWQTRLVFADWLEERGDPRAEGSRALGLLRLCPYYDRKDPLCWWTSYATNGRMRGLHGAGCTLEVDWLTAIELPGDEKFRPLEGRQARCTRRAAEDAAALAFGTLPPERRAELLARPIDGAEVVKPRRRRGKKA